MTYYLLTFCDAFKCRTPELYYYTLWGDGSCMDAAMSVQKVLKVSAWCDRFIVGGM